MELETPEILDLSRQALDVVKSRYLLCILVSQRIHQLEKGAQAAIEVDPDDYASPHMYLPLALKEIIEGSMDLEQVAEEA